MKKLCSLFLAMVMVVSMIPAAAAASFSDVQKGSWYADAVDYVVSNNLMSGYSSTQFGPNDTLNRAMMVQVLYNMEGKPSLNGQKHSFSDVPTSQWFNNAVTWGSNRGIVSGFGGGLFKPEDSVTIEQAAVILWNYSGAPAPVGSGDLSSMGIGAHSDWAANALRWCVENEVLGAVPFNNATEKATRAHIAKMLTNYLTNNVGSGKVTGVTISPATVTMTVGETLNLSVNVTPASADTGARVWSSSDIKVATVLSGKVTAKAPGTAKIYVEVDGVKTYSTITVKSANTTAVTGISLDITSHTMGEGWTQYLTATLSPAGASDTITWSSSDTKVATVDQKGKVTGVAGGTATITAKTSNGKTATCKVEVWHSHKLTDTKVSSSGTTEVYTCACGHSYENWIPAPAETGMDKLVKTLRSKGYRTDDGDYFLVCPYDENGISAFISYSPSDNEVTFLFGMEDATSETFAGLTYYLSTGKFGDALFSFENYSTEVIGFATLNPATYNPDAPNLRFTDARGSNLSSSRNDLANSGFYLAMTCWELTLVSETDISMYDLGFTKFDK